MTARLPPHCLNPQAYPIFLFYPQRSCIQDLSRSPVLSQVRKIKFPFDLHFSLPVATLSQRAMPPLPNGLLGGHSVPGCHWRLPRPYGSAPAPHKVGRCPVPVLPRWTGCQSFLCLLHHVVDKPLGSPSLQRLSHLGNLILDRVWKSCRFLILPRWKARQLTQITSECFIAHQDNPTMTLASLHFAQ